MARKPQSKPEVGTTGHVWDGIEEMNNPLPRWWLWVFYATIVWGVIYTIAYPAWPLINQATHGMLGYSTRGELVAALEAHEERNAPLTKALTATPPEKLVGNPDLHQYAINRGAAVFRANCSQCHGAGAAGATGYPNLLDDDWLWGGDLDTITRSIRHGIRNDTDADAHWSEMPAFGEILEEDEIAALVAHVQAMASGAEGDETGAALYADNCASCHGETGTGDREQGAPNLADAIWLYGGDAAAVDHSIRYARFGVMPAWGQRLSEADVISVSAYVHALGGGE